MDLFPLQLLALLALLHRAASASDATEMTGAVGRSVTFRSLSPAGDAFWSFGNDPIVTVLSGDPPRVGFSEEKYKRRFSVSENGTALTLSQLGVEDAGTYTAKIGGRTSTFTLRVYRELEELTVTCEAQNCSAGSCRFSLRCSAPGAGFGKVSYFWSLGNRPWDEGPTVLVANKSSWSEPEPLTCTAQNPVSSQNVTVTTPGGLCSAENATHSPGRGPLSGRWARIGAGAVAGVTLLSSVLLLVFLCKSKGWRKSHFSKVGLKDTGAPDNYTTVYAEVGPSQQRIPNGIKAKPAEAADGESSRTVYSLVKCPVQADDETEENTTTSDLEVV